MGNQGKTEFSQAKKTDGWKKQQTIRSTVRRVAKLNRAKFIEFWSRGRKRRCPRKKKEESRSKAKDISNWKSIDFFFLPFKRKDGTNFRAFFSLCWPGKIVEKASHDEIFILDYTRAR